MYQCRCLQRLTGLFVHEFGGGQTAQFVIDKRQQFLGR